LYRDNSRGAIAYAALAAELRRRDGHTAISGTDLDGAARTTLAMTPGSDPTDAALAVGGVR